jgi:hypothetical protein
MKITDEIVLEGKFFTSSEEEDAFHKDIELRPYNICILSYVITGNLIEIKSAFRYNRGESGWYNTYDICYRDFKLNKPFDYIHFLDYLETYSVPISKVRSFVNNTLQIAQAAEALTYYKDYLQDGTQS